MGFLDNDFLEEFLLPFGSKRGCALLGKTEFNKLDMVKNFFMERRILEWNGKDKPDDHFVIHDCQKKAQKDEIINVVAKYRDIPYVIFNNCENLLKEDDILRIFVSLIDKDEYFGKYNFINEKGIAEDFSASSFYVFLGNDNLLPQKSEYPIGSVESDRIDSFCTFIHCYDYNIESDYFG